MISKYERLLWGIILIGIWELFSRLGLLPSYIFPAFSTVTASFFTELINGNFLSVIFSSVESIVQGFSVSIFFSIIVASIAVNSKTFASFVMTLHGIFNPLPSVAILPMVILITGLSHKSIIILIFHAVFWPLMSTILTSFLSISNELIVFSQNMELPLLSRILLVYLPAISPYFLTGLRSSWGRAWRALISAEAIFGVSSGSVQGLGFYIYKYRAYANMTKVLDGVIAIIIINVFVENIFNLVELVTVKKWGMTK